MKIMYSSVFSVKAWLRPDFYAAGWNCDCIAGGSEIHGNETIASIIIEGVPISFSSLRAATFYFIVAIVKSELPFC